jgi:hypothetical protein
LRIPTIIVNIVLDSTDAIRMALPVTTWREVRLFDQISILASLPRIQTSVALLQSNGAAEHSQLT